MWVIAAGSGDGVRGGGKLPGTPHEAPAESPEHPPRTPSWERFAATDAQRTHMGCIRSLRPPPMFACHTWRKPDRKPGDLGKRRLSEWTHMWTLPLIPNSNLAHNR